MELVGDVALLCAPVEKLAEGVRQALDLVIDGAQVMCSQEADLDRARRWWRGHLRRGASGAG